MTWFLQHHPDINRDVETGGKWPNPCPSSGCLSKLHYWAYFAKELCILSLPFFSYYCISCFVSCLYLSLSSSQLTWHLIDSSVLLYSVVSCDRWLTILLFVNLEAVGPKQTRQVGGSVALGVAYIPLPIFLVCNLCAPWLCVLMELTARVCADLFWRRSRTSGCNIVKTWVSQEASMVCFTSHLCG